MSNNSSSSTPVYGGDEFNRRLHEIPIHSPVIINIHDDFVYAEMVSFFLFLKIKNIKIKLFIII